MKKLGSSMSRRQVLRGTAASALAIVAPAISNRALAEDSIVFAGYGGSNQEFQDKAFIKPFEKETGIKVVQTSGIDLARLKAMVTTQNLEWDVMNLAGVYANVADKTGLLDPIDTKIVDTSDMLVKPTASVMPIYSYYAGIAYNPTRVPGGKFPMNWPEFWDVAKFPGKRSMRSEPYETLEMALMADGVSPKNLYPLDVDRAFKMLDKIKPHVLKWGISQDAITLLQRNEVVYSYAFGGRVLAMKSAGVPMEIHRKSTLITPGNFVLPKGSKKRDIAMKFIAFSMRPDRQAEFCELQPGYSPSKRAALPLLSRATQDMQPDVDDPGTIVVDLGYWAEHYDKIALRFKEWMLT